MAPTEVELLAMRFSRMKALIEQLEQVCVESAEQREVFRALKDEMEATRRSLRPFVTPR
jgi:hypothetical protein